jgi:hypothetical protein
MSDMKTCKFWWLELLTFISLRNSIIPTLFCKGLNICVYYLTNFITHLFFYRPEDQAATPHRDNNCCEETHLAADYRRQSSADSSSSSCSNMTTQQSHETEQHTDTVSSSTYCSDKCRHHFREQKPHTERACTPESGWQSTDNGQQQKRRPRSLECKRRLSNQDDLLEVPETDSGQNNSTVVSPVISVEESQDDENVTIRIISQISRSPSLTSTCSLSLPLIASGTGGGK